ncbi:MAG: PASTA domain-containing protein, partial [Oscillospiraceae bacterium]|nr:PASTA domain-containing protein [Oscillospiraceae bacterium]
MNKRKQQYNGKKPVRKKQEVTTPQVRQKIFWLMLLLGVVCFCVLAGALVNLMLVKHDYYEAKAISNQTRSTSVTASRGTIYDRNMNVLAASASVETIFLDPLELKNNAVDIDFLARNLASILDLDANWIKEQTTDTSMRYKVIKRRQTKDVCDAVRAFINDNDIIGVHLEADSQRYYPYNTLASQLLGFTNAENKGAEGLEAYYNNSLSGTAGAVITTKGNNETEMLYSYGKYYAASDGNGMVLTIDTTVQYYLEKHLQDAIDRYDVQNGAFGIVYDVQTGDIVAMSTMGGYDPNQYLEIYDMSAQEEIDALNEIVSQYPEGSQERTKALEDYNNAVAAARLKQWRNRCVSDSYEPGSTFKVLTLAAAIDSGAVTTENHFYCGGSEKFEGRSQVLSCWKTQGHGSQTTANALQNSCNIAFAHIGLDTGGENLYEYLKDFGLMETTHVDLPGEASGIFHSKERLVNTKTLGTSYLISTSFGQTVKLTPIQLVRAVGAVVNGGYLLEPHIVSEVLDADGNIIEKNSRTVVRQVISEETSALMCELIESVVTDGTAGNAKVVGYRIGGKTGTAEKVDEYDEQGLQTDDKIVSFVGIAPMDDPRYVVLVALDTPSKSTGLYISGGIMAAPTVSGVFEDILPYLGVEPEYSEGDMSRVTVRMPNVKDLTESEAASILSSASLTYRIIGEGTKVVSQIPAYGKQLPGNSVVLLYMDDSMPTGQVEVPNLSGMTVAQATQALADAGLYIRAKGTDSTGSHVVATYQDIAAGTKVERGRMVTVMFTDTTAQ